MGKLQKALGRAERAPQKSVAKLAKPAKTPKPAAQPVAEERPERPPMRARGGKKIASRLARATKPEPAPKPEVVPTVEQARQRIRGIIADVTAGSPAVAVGLVLAIVTQETGNHAAADLLIQEYNLDEVFGLKPSGKKAKKLQR